MADHGRKHPVAIQIEAMLRKGPLSPSNECCIYKVPQKLRTLNPNAYTPKFVSIGPFHHGNPQLLTMDHKLTYCDKFIRRFKAISWDILAKHVQDLEPKVRSCYLENIILSVQEFIKVILVDCCFTLELLLMSDRNPDSNQPEATTSSSSSALKPWMELDIRFDLLLLENQLPFFVLLEIYNFVLAYNSSINRDQEQKSFWELAFRFVTSTKEGATIPSPPIGKIAHFTDLYRHYFLQPSFHNNQLPARREELLAPFYSATELKEAGVKFKVNESSTNHHHLQFSKHCLKIPQIMVTDHTELMLRNMVAFEQCHYDKEHYITDYVALLDFLINTEEDVGILVNNGIIINWLGDNKAVAKMFNGLCQNVVVKNCNDDYLQICKDLNAHYNHPWHRRMATLRRDYCNTTWKTVASIAAIVLLILTTTQTVCSILQVVA